MKNIWIYCTKFIPWYLPWLCNYRQSGSQANFWHRDPYSNEFFLDFRFSPSSFIIMEYTSAYLCMTPFDTRYLMPVATSIDMHIMSCSFTLSYISGLRKKLSRDPHSKYLQPWEHFHHFLGHLSHSKTMYILLSSIYIPKRCTTFGWFIFFSRVTCTTSVIYNRIYNYYVPDLYLERLLAL